MVAPAVRRRKHWGWGFEDEQPGPDELRTAAKGIRAHLGFGDGEVEQPVPLSEVELPPSRLSPPAALQEICSSEVHDRASHAYGKAYRDIVRAFRGRFDHVPDVVVTPAMPERWARCSSGAGTAAPP